MIQNINKYFHTFLSLQDDSQVDIFMGTASDDDCLDADENIENTIINSAISMVQYDPDANKQIYNDKKTPFRLDEINGKESQRMDNHISGKRVATKEKEKIYLFSKDFGYHFVRNTEFLYK